jgi:ATP-binding cassette subfamily F protein 3
VAAPTAADRKQQRRDEAAARAKLAPLRTEVASLERRLTELSAQRAEIERRLGLPDAYQNDARAKLDELLGQQARIAAESATTEQAWLAALERLESAT